MDQTTQHTRGMTSGQAMGFKATKNQNDREISTKSMKAYDKAGSNQYLSLAHMPKHK